VNSTICNSNPLPSIKETLDAMGKACYYTTTELANVFHQALLKEEDRTETPFLTLDGHSEFYGGNLLVPYHTSVINNKYPEWFNWHKITIYSDDIVMWEATVEGHSERLTEILDTIRVHPFHLKPDICEFLRKVYYLGHKIMPAGVKPGEGN
jgi:hypothetical protein